MLDVVFVDHRLRHTLYAGGYLAMGLLKLSAATLSAKDLHAPGKPYLKAAEAKAELAWIEALDKVGADDGERGTIGYADEEFDVGTVEARSLAVVLSVAETREQDAVDEDVALNATAPTATPAANRPACTASDIVSGADSNEKQGRTTKKKFIDCQNTCGNTMQVRVKRETASLDFYICSVVVDLLLARA